VAAEPAAAGNDYDPEVASIFSEEATELLESADGAVGSLRLERGNREYVTELKRVSFGPVSVRKLPLGGIRPLDRRELERLEAAVKGQAGGNR
jgi:hypothetical protein